MRLDTIKFDDLGHVDGDAEAEQARRDELSAMPEACKGQPPEPKNKGGRPKGFSGMRSKMPSALAQAFKKAGLDWKIDFAEAIKANNRDRIALWLKLLPYMITTSARAKVKRWKGKPSKAALIALEAMEDKGGI